jgi:hydrogenase maturation factor
MKLEEKNSGTINFSVSIDEANKIFKALGNLPFVEVYELIGKLNEQANTQLANNRRNTESMLSDTSFDIDQLLK